MTRPRGWSPHEGTSALIKGTPESSLHHVTIHPAGGVLQPGKNLNPNPNPTVQAPEPRVSRPHNGAERMLLVSPPGTLLRQHSAPRHAGPGHTHTPPPHFTQVPAPALQLTVEFSGGCLRVTSQHIEHRAGALPQLPSIKPDVQTTQKTEREAPLFTRHFILENGWFSLIRRQLC